MPCDGDANNHFGDGDVNQEEDCVHCKHYGQIDSIEVLDHHLTCEPRAFRFVPWQNRWPQQASLTRYICYPYFQNRTRQIDKLKLTILSPKTALNFFGQFQPIREAFHWNRRVQRPPFIIKWLFCSFVFCVLWNACNICVMCLPLFIMLFLVNRHMKPSREVEYLLELISMEPERRCVAQCLTNWSFNLLL